VPIPRTKLALPTQLSSMCASCTLFALAELALNLRLLVSLAALRLRVSAAGTTITSTPLLAMRPSPRTVLEFASMQQFSVLVRPVPRTLPASRLPIIKTALVAQVLTLTPPASAFLPWQAVPSAPAASPVRLPTFATELLPAQQLEPALRPSLPAATVHQALSALELPVAPLWEAPRAPASVKIGTLVVWEPDVTSLPTARTTFSVTTYPPPLSLCAPLFLLLANRALSVPHAAALVQRLFKRAFATQSAVVKPATLAHVSSSILTRLEPLTT
jgi:hypothetical protein